MVTTTAYYHGIRCGDDISQIMLFRMKQKGLTMRFQKMMSALTACCLGATALASMPLQANAADETLTFDFRVADSNKVTLTNEALAQGNVSLNVNIYITENPGVNAISLKMQVNDGEEQEDGSFGNYGFYMDEAQFASPYCFDSTGGDPSTALSSIFVAEKMNLGWIYSVDQTVNADAYAESGTTTWDSDVSWATDYAFATATLVVPKDTPAGTYVLDIRREKYLNSLSTETTKIYSQSGCRSAGVDASIAYDSVPLTIVVEDSSTTTTETTTTTTETTTTTTETTTTTTETTTTTTETTTTQITTTTETTTSVAVETFPAEVLPEGSDAYLDLLAGDDFTYIYGNVSAAPGETVKMPIYIYNDPGTAGAMLYIDYDSALTAAEISAGNAYRLSMQFNSATNPMAIVWATGDGSNLTAKNGKVLAYLNFTIPEDAEIGTTYEVNTAEKSADDFETEVDDTNGIALDVKYIPGVITVVAKDADGNATPALNRTDYSFTAIGETFVLELLNAGDGEVTWYTTAPDAVSVLATGNMATVTAKALEDAQVIAVLDGVAYTCQIRGGLFGDVNHSGRVDSEDAILALREYNSIELMNETFLSATDRAIADVDGSGDVKVNDVLCILKYYNNKEILHSEITWYEITGNPNAPGAPQ